ncbi:GDSL-type esterase/lipase family protein [Moritella sp. Urea-trap-13]|uniref:SGNH/GDSL hydrolase family protein n=1 Tax=Moritella sp. Urea-trap-13 TaxID=2058327 RepID=UPI000C325B39|nr:GDSL-type esterase/lipase family protein [Moritella sp. Urea-trap-13]PKH06057.1 peptidase [Moritella sp. Urea-trap-13]
MASIICFGDSITRGESDADYGGWADRIKTRLIKQFLETAKERVSVFNMGISGETTDGLMQRFPHEFVTRLSDDKKNTVLFGYGANDLANQDGKFLVTIESYIDNLSHCIEFALEKEASVVLINVTPIAAHLDGIPNVNNRIRNDETIRRYNQALLALSVKYSVNLIDVYTPFNDRKEDYLTADGLHPNSAGHELLYQVISLSLLS